jgi:hypothetical protein
MWLRVTVEVQSQLRADITGILRGVGFDGLGCPFMLEFRSGGRLSRNYNIMRHPTFSAAAVRQFLLHHQIADLTQLKQAVSSTVDVTIFRKLRELDHLTSYSHRGRYYTLREIAQFDSYGLWSCQAVWFSRYGTLLSTAESFVNQSPAGYFAEELAQSLHVEVHDALLQLVRQGRIARQQVSDLYLYTSISSDVRRLQLLARRTSGSVPVLTDFSKLEISPNELKAAIVLFYSLLDEQQRRLYAGLESLRLGRGGDSQLADFLGIDSHTVARGRQQLLDQDVEIGRMRRAGAGRKPAEKKRLK